MIFINCRTKCPIQIIFLFFFKIEAKNIKKFFNNLKLFIFPILTSMQLIILINKTNHKIFCHCFKVIISCFFFYANVWNDLSNGNWRPKKQRMIEIKEINRLFSIFDRVDMLELCHGSVFLVYLYNLTITLSNPYVANILWKLDHRFFKNEWFNKRVSLYLIILIVQNLVWYLSIFMNLNFIYIFSQNVKLTLFY